MPPTLFRALGAAAILWLTFSAPSSGQAPPPPAAAAAPRARSGADFPAERFDPIARTALYLAAYDQVAWVTSDSVLALVTADSTLRRDLGTEWFAYEQDSTWHAVYGRYDKASDRYVQVVHYAAVARGAFRRQAMPADSLLARRYGRALALTDARLPAAAVRSGARFNTYVRPIPGGGLELWYLPAWQPNGWLIHGMEFYYRVDSTGTRITDSSAVVSPLRGSRPDTTKVLNIANEERELPTVGQAFFALYYGRYFDRVYIRSRDFVSTFVNRGESRVWLHALKHE
jgi:hypothetical protein